jgi:ankyrin repeat protein
MQVRDLLKDHTDLDITLPGPDGDTALHVACLFGNLEVALVLVEHGKEAAVTNVNQQDGSTPLHDAAASGHVEVRCTA